MEWLIERANGNWKEGNDHQIKVFYYIYNLLTFFIIYLLNNIQLIENINTKIYSNFSG